MKDLSPHQVILACVALVGVTVAACIGAVDGSILVTIYTGVLFGALGYVNGRKSGELIAEDKKKKS